MKQTITKSQFIDAFRQHDGRYNQLGERGGLEVLFDYLEQYEQDTGEELELDVIALCCDYVCMPAEDVVKEYDVSVDPDGDIEEQAVEYLINNTSFVGGCDAGLIFARF